MPDKADYLDDLVLELRLLDVPGDRIGEILAEAENHLAESGENPEETFGPARRYARELLTREGKTPPRTVSTSNPFGMLLSGLRAKDWVIILASLLLTGIGAAALLNGILALLGADPYFGLPPWLLIVGGFVLLGAFLVGVRSLDDPIVDPRTGKRVDFDRRGHRTSSS